MKICHRHCKSVHVQIYLSSYCLIVICVYLNNVMLISLSKLKVKRISLDFSQNLVVICWTWCVSCYFVLVFFSPFSVAITSLGEERANLSDFLMFDRFVLVWICLFPLPLGVWEGLRFVIVALPGLFSYLFVFHICNFESV